MGSNPAGAADPAVATAAGVLLTLTSAQLLTTLVPDSALESALKEQGIVHDGQALSERTAELTTKRTNELTTEPPTGPRTTERART